jgi:hypothetical protein
MNGNDEIGRLTMGLECWECERDVRRPHAEDCSKRDAAPCPDCPPGCPQCPGNRSDCECYAHP